MNDDTFTSLGTSWTRQWVGDNAGRYEWRSDDARLLVYRDGSRYYAKLDLKAAYDAAASAGYTKAALKRAIKLHRMDADKRAKHDSAQAELILYLEEIEGRSRQFREAAE